MEYPLRILVIDNYDSFTYNLVHLIEQLDCPFDVRRNDQFKLEEVGRYTHLLISPGPGLPQNSGLVPQVIQSFKSQKSILGVCLGMQAILSDFGARLVNLPSVQHGAENVISIEPGARLFQYLPLHFKIGRYHNWGFLEKDIPTDFNISAKSEDGYIMAVEHKSLPLFGVQFHPESIMTAYGLEIMKNWISR